MPQTIADSLKVHRTTQLSERPGTAAQGAEWDLVFTRPDGAPLDGTVVTHQFHRLLDRARLPQRRFHDLRHSCATLMLAQGLPARVVMDVLGHPQIALTMNTYTHVLPELKQDAARRMNDLMLER
jgi:integrase